MANANSYSNSVVLRTRCFICIQFHTSMPEQTRLEWNGSESRFSDCCVNTYVFACRCSPQHSSPAVLILHFTRDTQQQLPDLGVAGFGGCFFGAPSSELLESELELSAFF